MWILAINTLKSTLFFLKHCIAGKIIVLSKENHGIDIKKNLYFFVLVSNLCLRNGQCDFSVRNSPLLFMCHSGRNWCNFVWYPCEKSKKSFKNGSTLEFWMTLFLKLFCCTFYIYICKIKFFVSCCSLLNTSLKCC